MKKRTQTFDFPRATRLLTLVFLTFTGLSLGACASSSKTAPTETTANDKGTAPQLPSPDMSHDVKNFSRVIGWEKNERPTAPLGFQVERFADGFRNPRWIYQAPNGDIFVAEAETMPKPEKFEENKKNGRVKSEHQGKSANRITLLRDKDGDGRYETRSTYIENLNQPFGMAVVDNAFFIATTDAVHAFPYDAKATKLKSRGQKIRDLPAGGYNNHWTRNLLYDPTKKKLLVSVGSGSNVGEHGMDNEIRRAAILEISLDGNEETTLASGLRNPVGMDFQPTSGALWTAVNERDNLGDDLVPDYVTEVKSGGFYGWPYAYFGQHEDPRRKGERPDLVAKTLIPDVPLGSHTASLGLAFYKSDKFPARYQGGAFIGQHGSWNRSTLSGYKVVFVPFKDGRPSGPPEDFLTGFVKGDNEVRGRPVGVTQLQNGTLLVADDSANTIWQIKAQP